MRTVEQLFIKRGDIKDIHRHKLRLQLWRANRTDVDVYNPLYPLLQKKILPSGRPRDPDVLLQDTRRGRYVRAFPDSGTSLMDKIGGFGNVNWEYLLLPEGTAIPVELIITKGDWMPKQGCFHYTISPNYTMSLEAFLRALDIHAFNSKIELQRKAK